MYKPITQLDDIMDGAITERFNQEMTRVLRNVFDPNTEAKAKRQIQIIIDVKPNDRRDMAEFRVDVKTKTCPPRPLAQPVFIRMDDDGNVVATEVTREVPGQIDMGGGVQAMPRVLEFGEAKQQ